MGFSRGTWVGIVLGGMFVLFGLWWFVQTRDPMILIFAVVAALAVGLVLFVIRLLRDGIPVRVVERPPK